MQTKSLPESRLDSDSTSIPKTPRGIAVQDATQGSRKIYLWGWEALRAPFPTPPPLWRGAARAASLVSMFFMHIP